MIKGAVLGSPISHSLSPLLHTSAFDFLGVEGAYTSIEVKSGELAAFLSEENEISQSFDYFSLTMPLKEELVRLNVRRDPLAVRIQSANTLFRSGSEWMATSTDGSGFLQVLSDVSPDQLRKTLILGAGGTARAVADALDSVSEHIHVMGRSHAREEAMTSCITRAEFTFLSWQDAIDFEFYDLIVNTTPAGAADVLISKVPKKIKAIYFDVLYKPLPTPLAAVWRDHGGRVYDGIDLLVYQGIDQLDLILDLGSSHNELAMYLEKVLRNSL